MRKLVALLGVLAAIDVVTSLWGLTHGYPEANPFMGFVVDTFGVWATAPFKVFLAVVTVALIVRISSRSRWPAWLLALVIFAIPAVSNTALLMGVAQ